MFNFFTCLIPGMITKEFTMNPTEKARFDRLYQRHLRALKLQGMSDKTIDVYARAVRRIAYYYDCCPDQLSTEPLQVYFASLLEQGLSLRHIQGLLGHASPTTTALYTQLTETTEQDTAATINRLVNTLHVDLRRL
jgi:integrase